ncbi:unnamed protein product [Kuraishia capsulata CBS 1993]|uniref:Uncharacterized protein n=1 Tax=Kuraishia capsulata CBS 1993 TaxID=1382522 RepID=W6MV83_9ASCO|nr:uncharacterized protein KUCA_T00002101001 [Kuraishia capsulata CBS 1993]CDK26130.1 unnamed protein product [Kuraishia capsulata CBS 1993]
MISPNKETNRKLSLFTFDNKNSGPERAPEDEAPTAPLSAAQQLNSPLSLDDQMSPTDGDPGAFGSLNGTVDGVGRSLSNPSDSSLIFERSVQDPLITTQPVSHCPRCLKPKSQCHHNSILNLPQHINSENFIPPALDSTASLLNSTKNLDDVDMVYSPRRPSTINLSYALGERQSERPSLSKRSSAVLQSPSSTNLRTEGSKSTLSFFSYADMINNEDSEANYQRRPSISQTLSQSFLGNPRLSRTNSAASKLRSVPQVPTLNTAPSSAVSGSLVSPASLSPALNRPGNPHYNFRKFALDSPSESDDDEKPLTNGSFSSAHSKTRDARLSVSHSMSSANSKLGSVDDVLDEDEAFVTRNVGDTLRRYTGELRG